MPASQFPQNIMLEDEMVLLSPLQATDIDNLLDISINEPETWEYSLVRANGKENLENYFIQCSCDLVRTNISSVMQIQK